MGSGGKLHDRRAELDAIASMVETVRSGRSGIVVVEGASGIGKSALLRAASEDVAGLETLFLRATQLESTRPFGPFLDALGCTPAASDPVRALVASLLAEGGQATTYRREAALQHRIADLLADMVEELTTQQPVIVLFDDLHWADPSSVVALSAVLRRCSGYPVGLVAALRPTPRGHDLEALLGSMRERGAEHIELKELAHSAVLDLVRERLQAEPGEALQRLVRGAHGNALFLHELLSALQVEGTLKIREGVAEVADPSAPPNLSVTILRHLSFLGRDTLEVLRSASLLGTAFEPADVAVIMQTSVTALADRFADARRSGFLIEDGSMLRFRHDLIREAIYNDIATPVRTALHAEAARRLAASDVPAVMVAQQFLLGASRGDREAIDWLRAAARQVGAASPESSVELLEHALALCHEPAPERAGIVAELGMPLVWVGRSEEAQKLAERASAQTDDPAILSSLRLVVIEALFAQGRWTEAIEVIEGALADGARTHAEEKGRLLCYLAFARNAIGDITAGEDMAGRAAALAEQLGDPYLLGYATTDLIAPALMRGELAAALQHAEGAVAHIERAVAQKPGDAMVEQDAVCAHAFLGIVLSQLDRLDEAHTELSEAMSRFERSGSTSYFATFAARPAFVDLLQGRWNDAAAGLEAAAEYRRELGYPIPAEIPAALAYMAYHRDDLALAQRILSEFDAEIDQPPFSVGWIACLVRAAASPDEAIGRLRELSKSSQPVPGALRWPGALSIAPLAVEMVRLAVAHDAELARELTDFIELAAARGGSASLRARAQHARGLLSNDATLLEQAADTARDSHTPLLVALTSEDAGVVLCRVGGLDEGRRLLLAALGIFEELGAVRDAGRATTALRSFGVRVRRMKRGQTATTGWEALTETERRVASLVREGLTNRKIADRLFVTTATVKTHLLHVFQKLQISSRAELAAIAAQNAEGQDQPSG